MKVSIIGTGSIGGTVAKKLVKAGYKVNIANSRGKSAVEKFAGERCRTKRFRIYIKRCWNFNYIYSLRTIPKLPKDIFLKLPKSSIVIDTSNYYPEVRKEEFDESKPESVWVSEQIGRKVIKTFNNMLAYSLENLGKDKNEKNRLCIQIAGDDEEQKKIVKKLINDCGFDPYDNGNLENS